MNNQTQLSATQAEILKLASYRPDGNIEPLPPGLRGGARTKVIGGLLSRNLIVPSLEGGSACYVLTDAAFAAVGRQRKAPVANPSARDIDTTVDSDASDLALDQGCRETMVAPPKAKAATGKPRQRESSKQAMVIGMLKRPEGAPILQIMKATGWQCHTCRGFFASALKKKLGLTLTSDKPEGSERIYKLCD